MKVDERWVLKSRFGYYGGVTGKCDKPIRWLKRPRMACKYPLRCAGEDIMTLLMELMGYDESIDELAVVPLKEVQT